MGETAPNAVLQWGWMKCFERLTSYCQGDRKGCREGILRLYGIFAIAPQ